MTRVLTFINSRASQIVAFAAALLTAGTQFGLPITDAQMVAIDAVLLTGIGLLAGRDIGTARRLPPE